MASSARLKPPLLALLFALAGPAVAANLYCCTDAAGKQLCADLLPPACYGRAYREVGGSGRTVRTVDAPLSAEQRAERAAAEARQKEQQALLAEQQRKDQALLNTYGSEKDIEMMRVRAKNDLLKAIAGAQTKIDEAHARRKHFEDEAEFYKKKQLPAEVQKGLRDTDADVRANEQFIAAKNQELDALGAKFDEELRRYRELSARQPAPR